jgi:hypothetical protein
VKKYGVGLKLAVERVRRLRPSRISTAVEHGTHGIFDGSQREFVTLVAEAALALGTLCGIPRWTPRPRDVDFLARRVVLFPERLGQALPQRLVELPLFSQRSAQCSRWEERKTALHGGIDV